MQCIDTNSENWDAWICPDLGRYWRLARYPNSDRIVLKPASSAPTCLFVFDAIDGYALQHFNGCNTVGQVQAKVQQKFPHADARAVSTLIERLIAEGIIATTDESSEQKRGADRFCSGTTKDTKDTKGREEDCRIDLLPQKRLPESARSILKPNVEWHYNPDGYWILWNREDRTYLQVSEDAKAIIEQLAVRPKAEVLATFELSHAELQELFQQLALGRMLPNQQPIQRRRGKFSPFQLLYFKRPLFNPDPWLNGKIGALRWLWTRPFAMALAAFLAASLAIGLDRRETILVMGQELMQNSGGSFFIPFALLSVFVVTLHELGHAFTLKHYGREVPEVGLLFMCLFPAAYTDTTDQYLLSKWQRVLVVGAGILVQVTMAAIALLLWNLAVPGSWLHSASYLLMVAALFTIAVNLNPMAKFDGYYLAVAATGINNLRHRAFKFYADLFSGKQIFEAGKDRIVLAFYAPFSLLYIWSVFGFLFYRLFDWTLVNIPALGLMLLLTWLLYYFAPNLD